MQKEQNGGITLETFREVYMTEVALRKSKLADEAPQTYEAVQASVTFWHDENATTHEQVNVPDEEIEIVISAIRRRSHKRLSLVTAKAARKLLGEYDAAEV